MPDIRNEELTNKSAASLSVNDVYFVSISESGAMGDSGVITVISLENKQIVVRKGNFVSGKIDLNTFKKAFPPLSNYSFDEPESPLGWKLVYMGAGNHLLVRQNVYPDFEKKMKPKNPVSKVLGLLNGSALVGTYARWFETAIYILNEKYS